MDVTVGQNSYQSRLPSENIKEEEFGECQNILFNIREWKLVFFPLILMTAVTIFLMIFFISPAIKRGKNYEETSFTVAEITHRRKFDTSFICSGCMSAETLQVYSCVYYRNFYDDLNVDNCLNGSGLCPTTTECNYGRSCCSGNDRVCDGVNLNNRLCSTQTRVIYSATVISEYIFREKKYKYSYNASFSSEQDYNKFYQETYHSIFTRYVNITDPYETIESVALDSMEIFIICICSLLSVIVLLFYVTFCCFIPYFIRYEKNRKKKRENEDRTQNV